MSNRRLQRVRGDGQLPPVGEDKQRRSRPGHPAALGQHQREPEAVGALVSVVAFEVGKLVLNVAADVLVARGLRATLGSGAAAGVVRRIGDHCVGRAVRQRSQYGQRVSAVELDGHGFP